MPRAIWTGHLRISLFSCRSLAEQPGRTTSGAGAKSAPRASCKRSEPAKGRKLHRQTHRRRA
jgi:hypothetical protein